MQELLQISCVLIESHHSSDEIQSLFTLHFISKQNYLLGDGALGDGAIDYIVNLWLNVVLGTAYNQSIRQNAALQSLNLLLTGLRQSNLHHYSDLLIGNIVDRLKSIYVDVPHSAVLRTLHRTQSISLLQSLSKVITFTSFSSTTEQFLRLCTDSGDSDLVSNVMNQIDAIYSFRNQRG